MKGFFLTYFKLVAIALLFASATSCEKFLDKNPDKGLVTPGKLRDLQALLDNEQIVSKYSALSVIGADEYFLTNDMYEALGPLGRESYLWGRGITEEAWYAYSIVYYTNVVLHELDQMDADDSNSEVADIKGQALFFRSFAFQYLAQLYCKPYSGTAVSDDGIVLRTAPDIETPSERSTIEQTYNQIINDLKQAARLLPESSESIGRPNKIAAHGALARTFISMRDYSQAKLHADSVLEKINSLIDFNSLSTTSDVPIGIFNPETIYYAYMLGGGGIDFFSVPVDTSLYQSYDVNDLRKVIFFKSGGQNKHLFKGIYTPGFGILFNGLGVSEFLLIRAECLARAGLKDAALTDLNNLLVTRWKNGSFIPFTAVTAEEAIVKILEERKKELIFRGLRWSDLRRLNIEGASITVTRKINGSEYILTPNDFKWAWLIPQEVITRSGIEQNPR